MAKADATLIPRVAPATRPRDARVVLIVVVALVVASIVTVRSAALVALLAFVCAWHASSTGSLSATAASLARVFPLAAAVVVLNAVFGPGDAIVSVGGVRLAGDRGLANGMFFALRLAVMLMSVSLLLAALTPEALARGLHDLTRRVSVRGAERLALFVFLAMGFVPLVTDEFARIRMAQSSRGAELTGGLRRRIDAVHAWMVPLLVSAIHRSGHLAMAVELRDIQHRLPRVIAAPRACAADRVFLISALVTLVAVWRLAA
ncbi:MAG TPA: energy-coupling factor transporter transmembrane component T [Candidatus Krumholzibacteria bacterium]|nr:energy-coupling factor transporter transmembrane component T [Candidatus Krumholzibacteria bacterium]